MQVFEEIVFMDLDVKDIKTLFETCVEKFIEMDYVDGNYLEAIMAREEKYPTGLPTVPYGVAIPHADAEHVKKSGISVVKSKTPIKFKEMGVLEGEIYAKYIFFLIIEKGGNSHIKILQQLINFLMDEKNMHDLDNAKSPKDIADVINLNLKQIEEGGSKT